MPDSKSIIFLNFDCRNFHIQFWEIWILEFIVYILMYWHRYSIFPPSLSEASTSLQKNFQYLTTLRSSIEYKRLQDILEKCGRHIKKLIILQRHLVRLRKVIYEKLWGVSSNWYSHCILVYVKDCKKLKQKLFKIKEKGHLCMLNS